MPKKLEPLAHCMNVQELRRFLKPFIDECRICPELIFTYDILDGEGMIVLREIRGGVRRLAKVVEEG